MAVSVLYRKWNDDIVSVASKLLLEEMPLPAGSPGGMEAFRCSLTSSFFFKYYLTVRLKLEQKWVSSHSQTVAFLFRIFANNSDDKSTLN